MLNYVDDYNDRLGDTNIRSAIITGMWVDYGRIGNPQNIFKKCILQVPKRGRGRRLFWAGVYQGTGHGENGPGTGLVGRF